MLIMNPNKLTSADEFQSEGLKHFGIEELLEKENIDWESIKKNFKTDPGQFEELLFKIHYKRKKILSARQRTNVLIFLSIGYVSTNDIRYFNEFLWFYTESSTDKPLMDGCMEKFNSNLNNKRQHPLPDQFSQYPVDISSNDLSKIDDKNTTPLRICLIGFPPFFGTIVKKLKKDGHHVEQFFLPYHPDSRINSFLKFSIPVKILSLLAGNSYSYHTLNFDHKDERIGEVLKQGNFDIGFHKLNFIIRSNIFGTFRKGLLNDHWGYLPLLRGKSTIAYSLLMNVPVIPTIHFINKGIDAGPIAGYYPCNYSSAKSVKEIRHLIKKAMPERVVAAIKHVGSSNFIPKENKKESGITFYEIHPWLSEHIASRILKQ